MRRTKIIATVGPATDGSDMVEKLLLAGVDLFRVNYSHQDHASHERRVKQIRDTSAQMGLEVGIIADLQGPKIRIERFSEGRIKLREGDEFILDSSLAADAGDARHVGQRESARRRARIFLHRRAGGDGDFRQIDAVH